MLCHFLKSQELICSIACLIPESMIPSPLPRGFVAIPQAQLWQPLQHAASSFWQPRNVHEHIRKLQETIDVSQAMLNELEALLKIKTGRGSVIEEFLEVINAKKIGLDEQESLSIEAANSICSHLKALVAPLGSVTNKTGPWEEGSLAVKSGQRCKNPKETNFGGRGKGDRLQNFYARSVKIMIRLIRLPMIGGRKRLPRILPDARSRV